MYPSYLITLSAKNNRQVNKKRGIKVKKIVKYMYILSTLVFGAAGVAFALETLKMLSEKLLWIGFICVGVTVGLQIKAILRD